MKTNTIIQIIIVVAVIYFITKGNNKSKQIGSKTGGAYSKGAYSRGALSTEFPEFSSTGYKWVYYKDLEEWDGTNEWYIKHWMGYINKAGIPVIPYLNIMDTLEHKAHLT